MLPFIDSPDEQQGPPPYAFRNMTVRGVLLGADMARLAAWCDQRLNMFPRYRFEPLAPVVCLGINIYPEMRSAQPLFRDRLMNRQHEYYLMFPAIRHDAGNHGFLLSSALTWVFPFIGVDNSSSALTGQEVLGYQKMLGTITAEEGADGSFRSEVSMPGMKAFGPGEMQAMLPLLSLSLARPLAGQTAAHGFPWMLRGLDVLDGLLTGAAAHLLGRLAPDILSVTNLKQFRDAETPMLACYTALVTSDYALSNTGPTILYADARVSIRDNAAVAPTAVLGLDPELRPLMAFGVTTDMLYGTTTTNLAVDCG